MTVDRSPDTMPKQVLGCLQALQEKLNGEGFITRLDQHRAKPPSLRVRHASCPEMADEITCGQNPDDSGALWFFFSWGHPITRAAFLTAAILSVKHVLGVVG